MPVDCSTLLNQGKALDGAPNRNEAMGGAPNPKNETLGGAPNNNAVPAGMEGTTLGAVLSRTPDAALDAAAVGEADPGNDRHPPSTSRQSRGTQRTTTTEPTAGSRAKRKSF